MFCALQCIVLLADQTATVIQGMEGVSQGDQCPVYKHVLSVDWTLVLLDHYNIHAIVPKLCQ